MSMQKLLSRWNLVPHNVRVLAAWSSTSYSSRSSFQTLLPPHRLFSTNTETTIPGQQSKGLDLASTIDHINVFKLISAYRSVGHLIANLDPLQNAQLDPRRAPFQLSQVEVLQKEYYGFTDNDVDKLFQLDPDWFPQGPNVLNLGQIIDRLNQVYCGPVAVECRHILAQPQVSWLLNKTWDLAFDSGALLERSSKLDILRNLLKAERFESSCGSKYSGAKRFSLEGGEALIAGLEELVEHAALQGVECIELGMAHRGRLNVLHNVLKIPMETIVTEFQSYLPDEVEYPNHSDDVRYHLGCLVERPVAGGQRTIDISLASNPSHLEAVNSVVLGKTRARQFLLRGSEITDDVAGPLGRRGSVDYSPDDKTTKQVMAVLLHGDASFFQGSVRECLGFSRLRDYTTGGSIHVIVNNQIGFTTMPKESHSSVYCSDVAKSIGAPILHVNADYPEKVVQVFRMAVEYRQLYGGDIVVNLWCYRRHGHNEQDKPELTQPIMYNTIRRHPCVTEQYAKQLIDAEVCTQDDVDDITQEIEHSLSASFEEVERASESSKSGTSEGLSRFMGMWDELRLTARQASYEDHQILIPTGVEKKTIQTLGRAMLTLPPPAVLDAHPKVRSIFRDMLASVEECLPSQLPKDHDDHYVPVNENGMRDLMIANSSSNASTRNTNKNRKGITWATAEALSFATLLGQGFHIRLSGQDVERGTFNQRHAVVYDQTRSKNHDEVIYKPWTALQSLWDEQKIPAITPWSAPDEELSPEMKRYKEIHLDESSSIHRGAHLHEVNRRLVGLPPSLGVMEICNSPLSEEAVLGFEHGYSLYSNHILVIWEAQFGDFADCAQTIIDTYIVSGEAKWIRSTSIVLLLPHGYEGQGPDHSSAKVERFLQLSNDDGDVLPVPANLVEEAVRLRDVNVHVVNCTTPAQYFHLLRRHVLLPFRKPLVVFTPKYLLHHKHCVSYLEDFEPGKAFHPVLQDAQLQQWLASDDERDEYNNPMRNVNTVLLCSGKMRYHLMHKRRARQAQCDVSLTDESSVRAILSVEQICPFPSFSLSEALQEVLEHRDPSLGKLKVAWVQEEPRNMGAWTFALPRITTVLNQLVDKGLNVEPTVEYIGRKSAAYPATGSYRVHVEEMDTITETAIPVR